MNTIDLLILGLLSDKHPRNGYQIRRNLVSLGISWWSKLGKSSVYFALKKLEHKRFIEIVKLDDPAAPTSYRATYKGRKDFRDHFKKSSRSINHQDSFKAMLALLPSLPNDERIDVLESRRSELETQVWWLRDYKKDEIKIPNYLANNNELLVNLYEVEINWINNTIDNINNHTWL